MVDGVGHVPFGPEATDLLIPLVSEHGSLIVTNHKSFGRWGEVFGGEAALTAVAKDRRTR